MNFLKKLSLSKILFICFILSCLYSFFSISYKMKNFGFSINPEDNKNVWLVEGTISYIATGEPVKIKLNTPNNSMIIDHSINGSDYKIKEKKVENRKIIELTSDKKIKNSEEKIYYKLLLLENKNINNVKSNKNFSFNVDMPYLNDSQKESSKKLLNFAKNIDNTQDFISNLIMILNGKFSLKEVKTFIPLKTDEEKIFEITEIILATENIPVKMIRGVRLIEDKNLQKPDLLLMAYLDNEWKIYDLKTGKIGIPENFLIFQNGGESLLDVEGGKNSKILFSVLKNKYNSLFLSKYKAETSLSNSSFKYSMYNLPLREQNILKIITVFPLAILSIVILRNIIGVKTIGTFTPMLIAMSFIQTGLLNGLIAFVFLITIGLLIRRSFSKMQLLLVPRISAVVVLVIFIIQILTILSYNFNIQIGLSLLFFPLIITAWIIERSSITIEENGEIEAIKENIITLLVAVFTYLVISSEEIRYTMYVFNEINISIFFLILLIGTYTGYRLTELIRFKPIIKD